MRLAGQRPDSVLFLCSDDSESAVVVRRDSLAVTGPFPAYEIVPGNWDSDVDPADVPTGVFTAAEQAFNAASDSVSIVTASGKTSGKRTYAVPKNVRETAKRALKWRATHKRGGTDVGVGTARKLASGDPVSLETVKHVHRYFPRHEVDSKADGWESGSASFPSAGRIAWDLWGGDAGRRWASRIVERETAVAAAAAPAPVAQPGRVPLPEELPEINVMEEGETSGPVFDDTYMPWRDPYLDPELPHLFVPGEHDQYACFVCGEPASATVHVNTVSDQVRAQYGEDAVQELAPFWADDDTLPSSGAPLTLRASADLVSSTNDNDMAVLIASAFFGPHSEDCDYFAETDDDGNISVVYVAIPSGSWHRWDPAAKEWEESGDATDAGLLPLDASSAYVAALHQTEHGDRVPVGIRDVHPTEWAMFDEGKEAVAAEVDDFYALEPAYYTALDEESGRVDGLYAERDGSWSRWDPGTTQWVPTSAPDGQTMEIDESTARETALWLSSAHGAAQPDEDVIDALRAAGTSSSATGYTPEERSQNAQRQVRDRRGRFARAGSRAGYNGRMATISKINPTNQSVLMRYDDNNQEEWVPARNVQVAPASSMHPMVDPISQVKPIPRGNYPGMLPPWSREEMYAQLDRYQKYVEAYRASLAQGTTPPPAPGTPEWGKGQEHGPLDKPGGKGDEHGPLGKETERDRTRRPKRAGMVRGSRGPTKSGPVTKKGWAFSDDTSAIVASANHDGVMVAFYLPEELAEKYALSGGEPAGDLHLTLAYLGDQDDVPVNADVLEDAVRDWASRHAPISGTISGHGVFTNGPEPVTHLSVDCPGLPAARQDLVETLQRRGIPHRQDHGFDPHVTLAYDRRDVEPDADPLMFDRVVVSYGDDNREIPLQEARVAAAPADTAALTPTTTDVPPMYMAIVDDLDRSAVMELLALVPRSKKSSVPVLYRRAADGWVKDDALLRKMRSTNPPPVTMLDQTAYQEILKQVDGFFQTQQKTSMAASLYSEYGELLPLDGLSAAGGLDRNRGNAERLRRYWTIGPGGAKIRWGQGGDWYRCVRHLSKYLGPRAKGYCQLRHKEMLGMYTSTHAKALRSDGHVAMVLEESAHRVEEMSRMTGITAATSAAEVVADGTRFVIPVVVPEGVETGDGRVFKPLAVSHRDLPLPLLWQMKTSDGHDGSVVVGKITHIERVSNGLGNAQGVLDTSPHALEVERLIREGFLRGVSADLDQFEAETAELKAKDDQDEDKKIGNDQVIINKARVMGMTIVPKPAFQECVILLSDEEEGSPVIPDGVYEQPQDDVAVTASAQIAERIPTTPPKSWFAQPELRGPTPLTVTDDGRVFGHVAAWHVDHIGLPMGTKPPRSRSGYAYFHSGVVRTEEGDDVPVGQLTLSGGHAPLDLTADAAVRHYDDTNSAVADVHLGEDMFGIWAAGALRPGVTPDQIRSLRASAPSGDWRPINGRLELVAVCQVNVPGFPITRARVAAGYVTALVAAGTAPLLERMRMSEEDVARADVAYGKLAAFREEKRLQAQVASLRSRVYRHPEALAASVDALRQRVFSGDMSDLADYSSETREKYAKKGWALDDGSYPIANVGDLRNAIRAYGRSSPSSRARVRRHIMKRARGLGRSDLIPTSWTSASIDERAADIRAAFAEIAATTASGAALRFNDDKFREELHPRDDVGRFKRVLFRLRDDLQVTPGGDAAIRDIDEAIKAMDEGDLEKAKSAANDVVQVIDEAMQDTVNPEVTRTLKAGYRALGEAIARLPMPQGRDEITYRWSDLPESLVTLVESITDRLMEEVSPEVYDEVTAPLRRYQAGNDYVTSDEFQGWLTGMLSYLLD